jgi:hypothetical protein
MNRDFVPYEESLAFKELGFDEPCLAYYLLPEIERTGDVLLHYCSRGKEIIRNNDWSWVYENFPTFRKYLKAEHCYTYSTNSSRLMVSAPTWSQAFRWFREKYRLDGHVTFRESPTNKIEGINSVYYDIEIYTLMSGDAYKTYNFKEISDKKEEAELACLNKLIEIIKTK